MERDGINNVIFLIKIPNSNLLREWYGCNIKNRGLNKENGVLIPVQNVKNLTLSDEIIESVRNGDFHIYPVSTIDEGIEILTGVYAGNLTEDGTYERGSINYLVSKKLNDYAIKSKNFN